MREGFPAACLRKAFGQGRIEQVEALWIHPDRKYAVRDLCGTGHPGWRDRSRVDPERGIPVKDALQRLAEAARIRSVVGNLVVEPLVNERLLAGHDLADDRDVFLRARERTTVGGAMPALDDLRSRRTEAEDEATARERVE